MSKPSSAVLRDQVAVVTGGARGIGLAITTELAARGATVVVGDLDRDAAEAAAAQAAGTALGLPLDVSDHDAVAAALDTVRARTCRTPSILVNNAGTTAVGPSRSLPMQKWQRVVDVNLTGVWSCCQVFGGAMIDAGGGCIVNIASTAAEFGMPGRAVYCATKAGVMGLTRALAVEWGPVRVRVNAVEPGYVRTDLIAQAVDRGLLDEQEILARTPDGRLADPADIARAVAFLVGPDAAHIAGAGLVVDGGALGYGGPGAVSPGPVEFVPDTNPA